MSGAYAFKVLMFLRLVIDCRLTCLYPLLSCSVYRHIDEGSGRPAWPMFWDSTGQFPQYVGFGPSRRLLLANCQLGAEICYSDR